MYKINIIFDQYSFPAELNEGPTSEEIWDQLPIEARVNTWGEEIYFEIPVDMPQEPGAREILAVGELAYWPVGKTFCIFFGPTPISMDERPRAYSPVNIIGKILGDCTGLKSIKDQSMIRLEKIVPC